MRRSFTCTLAASLIAGAVQAKEWGILEGRETGQAVATSKTQLIDLPTKRSGGAARGPVAIRLRYRCGELSEPPRVYERAGLLPYTGDGGHEPHLRLKSTEIEGWEEGLLRWAPATVEVSTENGKETVAAALDENGNFTARPVPGKTRFASWIQSEKSVTTLLRMLIRHGSQMKVTFNSGPRGTESVSFDLTGSAEVLDEVERLCARLP